ncbi:MAG: aminotransferase class V-fold PLP-dependent enzyme [Bacteroidota bacterium]
MPAPMDLSHAKSLDHADPLKSYRERFYHSEPGLLYMDGNSLGKLPLETLELSQRLVQQQWGDRLIRSWNEGWLELPQRIGDKIGQLVGARQGEVIVADSTSINLFKLVSAALSLRPGRSKILTDTLNFPSDLYILEGVSQMMGKSHSIQLVDSHDGVHGPEDELIAQLDSNTALLTLSHTVYKSGYVYDMKRLTQAAHEVGALVLWDLSHSTGAVAVDLHTSQADIAVGCTYKYLNGGPGSPAFMFVKEALQASLQNPISGWMGHQDLFAFSKVYSPAPGIKRFLAGTPAIVSTALIEPGVDILLEAGIPALVEKSQKQIDYFYELWAYFLKDLGFQFESPREAQYRGSHATLSHEQALPIDLALIHEKGVIPDFRAPHYLRFGMAPIYTSFEEIYLTIQHLKEIYTTGMYLSYQDKKPSVT